jgi:phosphoribosylamine--glycine ligase
MKVLVIGSGGREHALVWKLKKSKKVSKLFCAPGNGGISQLARCINMKADNFKGLADFAVRNKINLTVVGPEAPLAMGIVDEFQKRKLKIFGPNKNAAQIESSKVFARQSSFRLLSRPMVWPAARELSWCEISNRRLRQSSK